MGPANKADICVFIIKHTVLYEPPHEIPNNVLCAMIVKLLTEHNLKFLGLKGGCRGSCESSLVKM